MKKIVFMILLTLNGFAFAGHGHHGNRSYYHNHNHNRWVAPFIVGGVLGAVIVNQVQSQPQVIQHMPPPPYGYAYIQIYDYYCNCYKLALTPRY